MDTKLELQFRLFGEGSVAIILDGMSKTLFNKDVNTKLFTKQDGYIIETGYKFRYSTDSLVIPTYKGFLDYNDFLSNNVVSYYTFSGDKERKEELERLFECLDEFSQSIVFQYDNTGYVGLLNDKWYMF